MMCIMIRAVNVKVVCTSGTFKERGQYMRVPILIAQHRLELTLRDFALALRAPERQAVRRSWMRQMSTNGSLSDRFWAVRLWCILSCRSITSVVRHLRRKVRRMVETSMCMCACVNSGAHAQYTLLPYMIMMEAEQAGGPRIRHRDKKNDGEKGQGGKCIHAHANVFYFIVFHMEILRGFRSQGFSIILMHICISFENIPKWIMFVHFGRLGTTLHSLAKAKKKHMLTRMTLPQICSDCMIAGRFLLDSE